MPVYVNRLLNFKKIKVVGFDMDYTLVTYDTDQFEKLVHKMTLERLVRKFGYPASIKELEFDQERAILGLVIDNRYGNLLKLSRYGKVKLAFHGLEQIDFREHERLYRERAIDLRDPDFQSLDTAFAISQGVLYSQLVQLKKNGQAIPNFRQIDVDVNLCIDGLHKDGSLKSIIQKNLDQYVVIDPKTAEMLEILKLYGKKLMVITNSDYQYTSALLDYSLNPYWKKYKSWRDVFDLVITLAEKPRFFEGPSRFLRIDSQTGGMTNHEGPVASGIWQGGWFGDVQSGLNIDGNEILYLGDHIYGDVVSIKKLCDWRTGLVLGGLEQEIKHNHSSQQLQRDIDMKSKRKDFLEREFEELEMQRRLGLSQQRISRKHADELELLNLQISEQLSLLKGYYNPWWGEILRAGSEESRYADQMQSYACIYMTRVSDLGEYSPRTYFRPQRRLFPHEAASL